MAEELGSLEKEFRWKSGLHWIVFFIGVFAVLLALLLMVPGGAFRGNPSMPWIILGVGVVVMGAFWAELLFFASQSAAANVCERISIRKPFLEDCLPLERYKCRPGFR